MSSSNDEERWTQILLSEPKAARITAELIEEALNGFALQPQRDMHWLARAIQPAVYIAAKADYPAAKGNAAIRDELQRLADRADGLWRDIFEMSDEAREAVDRYVWKPWIEGGAGASPDGIQAQYAAWADAQDRLYWQARFLGDAAKVVGAKKQPPKWSQTAKKHWRMWFAFWLAPAFEKGFGKKPGLSKQSASNAWGLKKSGRRSLGTWADFYQRIMAAAFDEKATPNLADVLQEALKRGMPTFEPGFFPK